MPLPKSIEEIKANPVFLVGVIMAIIGIGVALYGHFIATEKKKLLLWSGIAVFITALAVAFGSTYLPAPVPPEETVTTRTQTFTGGLPGISTPM